MKYPSPSPSLSRHTRRHTFREYAFGRVIFGRRFLRAGRNERRLIFSVFSILRPDSIPDSPLQSVSSANSIHPHPSLYFQTLKRPQHFSVAFYFNPAILSHTRDLPVCPKFPLSSPSPIVRHLVVPRPLCADLRKTEIKLNYSACGNGTTADRISVTPRASYNCSR